jgi:hypothetical protein
MNRKILGVILILVAAPALAITTTTTTTPSPSAEKMNVQGVSTSPAAAKAMADDSSGMRQGTLEAVNVGTGTFHVYGQQLTFDAQRVRVFGRDGKASSIYALKTGAKVRFTLDASDLLHRRVAVIYID